jgi:hypothetical protein
MHLPSRTRDLLVAFNLWLLGVTAGEEEGSRNGCGGIGGRGERWSLIAGILLGLVSKSVTVRKPGNSRERHRRSSNQ